MQASVEALGNFKYRVKVEVPADRFNDVMERRLRELGGPNTPLSALRRAHGEQAWRQTLEEVGQATCQEVLQQRDLKPTAAPEIEWLRRAQGADCEYSATFEIYPDIRLEPLDTLEIEEPAVEVTEADVDQAIETLRREHRRFAVTERPAATGDKVVFDFEGRIDDQAFEGSEGFKAAALLGDGDVLDDMERALLERRAGESFDTTVTFPDDYATGGLRGYSAEFHITVHSVQEPQLPALDPEFVQTLGIAPDSVEALRAEITARLEGEAERARKRLVRSAAVERLLEAHPIEVPDSLVARESEALRNSFGQAPDKSNQDGSGEGLPEEVLLAAAKRKVALGLLLAEVLRANSVQPDPERVEAKLGELAESFGDPEQVKNQYRQQESLMRRVEGLVAEEMAVDTLLANARRTRKPMSVADVLQQAQ